MYTKSNDYKYLINQLIKKNVFGNNLSEDEDKRGGILEMFMDSSFDTFDPSIIYTGRDLALFSSLIYRTILVNDYDQNGNIILKPDLATDLGKYITIDDINGNPIKSSWTFTLKNNVKFADGSVITCEDLKYAAARNFSISVENGGPIYFYNYLDIPRDQEDIPIYKGPDVDNTIEAIMAFDDAIVINGNTITYNLNKPAPDFNNFFTYLASGPIKINNEILASGPYKSPSIKLGTYTYVFDRNNNWSNDEVRKAYPDKILIHINQESNFIANHMIHDINKNIITLNSIDNTDNNNLLRTQIINNYTVLNRNYRRCIYQPSPFVLFLFANCKKLNDLNIRKAIFYAMNQQLFANNYGDYSGYTTHDNPISPTITLDYTPTTIGNDQDVNFKYEGNLEYAEQLLEAGKISNPELYNRITDPNRGLIWYIPLSINTTKEFYKTIANHFKLINIYIQFREVIDTYAIILDPNNDGDILRSGWGADWNNASTVLPVLFLQDGGWNISRNYVDSEYNNIKSKIENALIETDRNIQATKWHEISQLVMERFYILKCHYVNELVVCGSNVGNFTPNSTSGGCNFNAIYLKNK